jgi:peptide/nickel transport system ATP-binding protein
MSEQAASAGAPVVAPAVNEPILQMKNLHTYFFTDLGISRALNGVTLDVPAGKVMGVVGESGCGKSVTALSILRLVPRPGKIVKGEILLRRVVREGKGGQVTKEVNITNLNPQGKEIRSIRGDEIAMIFQEPMTSMNPSYTVGNQIIETIRLHQDVSKSGAEAQAVKILDQVGMPNPGTVVKRYPHELSGGMRQRAMIAMALSCAPSILIADEPTTALDVTTEAQILDLMRELQAQLGMTIIYITHNLGVVAQMCDTVAVMYLGRVVELAPVDDLFYDSKHPYTRALMHSIPHVGSRTRARLEPIRGVVPDAYAPIKGCPFHPRCDFMKPGLCDVRLPATTAIGDQHLVRCFLYSEQGEETNEA